MAEMQADMQQTKSQIDKLRSDAEKAQDANTKTALLGNADVVKSAATDPCFTAAPVGAGIEV